MEEFAAQKYIEAFTFYLYMIFIFLLVQIWFLWKDVDKSEAKIKFFFNDSFFRKNYAFVSFFSIFFIINAVSDGTYLPDTYLDTLKMLAPLGLVLFAYQWYDVLEKCAPKKSLPQELTGFRYLFKKN